MRPNGYVLHRDAEIAVIATTKSNNRKTGDMVQIWILCAGQNPVSAVRSGSDSHICGDCKHRGNGFQGRTCYVNVGQGPNAVYRAFRTGSYPELAESEYSRVFKGRRVRFGAYGDPVHIPLSILRNVAMHSDGWTGYTHQWRDPRYRAYSGYVMASVDSIAEYHDAKAQNWRTFRVRSADEPLGAREIACPASSGVNAKTTCNHCRLCNGMRPNDGRKDIAVVVHGAGAKNFVSLQDVR